MKGKLALLLTVGGYLIGSISFARLVGRKLAPGEDLTATTVNLPGDVEVDYGGVSATSIAVRRGPAAGVATGVLDAAKSFVPVLATKRAFPDRKYHLLVALAVMVGHNYPVFHRFKGGRGQSPFFGSMLALDPLAVPVTTTAGTLVGLVVVRDMVVS